MKKPEFIRLFGVDIPIPSTSNDQSEYQDDQCEPQPKASDSAPVINATVPLPPPASSETPSTNIQQQHDNQDDDKRSGEIFLIQSLTDCEGKRGKKNKGKEKMEERTNPTKLETPQNKKGKEEEEGTSGTPWLTLGQPNSKRESIYRKRQKKPARPPINNQIVPDNVRHIVECYEGSNLVFFARKRLTVSDVNSDLNRLFIPKSGDLKTALTETEEGKIYKGVDVIAVDIRGKPYDMVLKKWESMEQTVFIKNWTKLVKNNNLKAQDDSVELWSFRADSKLYFVVNILRDGKDREEAIHDANGPSTSTDLNGATTSTSNVNNNNENS